MLKVALLLGIAGIASRGQAQVRVASPCRREPFSGGPSLSVSPTRPLRLDDDHPVGAARAVERRLGP